MSKKRSGGNLETVAGATAAGRDPREVSLCTCASVRRAARAVTRAYDAALAPSGLKATQFTILAALSKLGDAPMTRLAEVLGMDRTTLTRNLRPLIGAGLIVIAPEADERVRRVRLTPAGYAAFERALPLWRSVQHRLVDRLGRERWSDLLDALRATVEAVLPAAPTGRLDDE